MSSTILRNASPVNEPRFSRSTIASRIVSRDAGTSFSGLSRLNDLGISIFGYSITDAAPPPTQSQLLGPPPPVSGAGRTIQLRGPPLPPRALCLYPVLCCQ